MRGRSRLTGLNRVTVRAWRVRAYTWCASGLLSVATGSSQPGVVRGREPGAVVIGTAKWDHGSRSSDVAIKLSGRNISDLRHQGKRKSA